MHFSDAKRDVAHRAELRGAYRRMGFLNPSKDFSSMPSNEEQALEFKLSLNEQAQGTEPTTLKTKSAKQLTRLRVLETVK